MFLKFLDNIQDNLFYWIFGAFFFGLLEVKIFGGYGFNSLICLLAAFVMIYPSLVPLAFNKLGRAFKNYKIILISIILNFVLAPLLAVVIGYFFLSQDPVLWLGLILLSLLPGGGMVTTWALKSKADMPATIGVVFSNLMVAILVVPVFLPLALNRLEDKISQSASVYGEICPIEATTGGVFSCGLGGEGITPMKIIIPIIFIIIIPLILAYFTQVIIKKKKGKEYFENIKINFNKFSNFGLVIILFILMGLRDNAIIFQEPSLVLKSILALVIFYFITLLTALIIYSKVLKGGAKGRAFVWGSYLRYITLALGMSLSLIFQNSNLTIMVIIIILSYFIQIPSSFWLANYFKKYEE